MNKPAFVADYDPAGRLVFAMVPGRVFLEMFEYVVEVTGRKIPNILVSMFYLRGRKGGEKLARIRAMCDRLFIDSGVFSFRSKILTNMGIHFKAAYWTLSDAERQKMLEAGLANRAEFDAFAEEYCVFIKKYSDLFDIAIDLDVEQFLGMDVAELYYRNLLEVAPAEKIMRVWHSHGRDWEDWKKWCRSGKYTWLSLEGPDQHNRDVGMYNRFIDYAHQYNIKVHILAVTTLQFMGQVTLDTCDSSTYTVGGRFARLLMPTGRDILIGKRYKAYYPSHFDNQSEIEQVRIVKLMTYLGFTPDELAESHDKRCLFNILVFLMYYDKPTVRTATSVQLF